MQYESQYYGIVDFSSPHLSHHGIKGQKWGIRRFQNADGSLTADGKRRYLTEGTHLANVATRQRRSSSNQKSAGKAGQSSEKHGLTTKQKIAIGVGVAAVGVIAAKYGAKQYSEIRELKSELKGFAFRDGSVGSIMQANWSRYSLATKSKLASLNKSDDFFRGDKMREIAKNRVASKETLSSKMGMAIDRNERAKEIISKSKENKDAALRYAQLAYANRSPDVKELMDRYELARNQYTYAKKAYGGDLLSTKAAKVGKQAAIIGAGVAIKKAGNIATKKIKQRKKR